MRVLHVISTMDPAQGGVAQAVRTIIAGLLPQKVHSEVVSLDEPKSATWSQTDFFTTYALGPKHSSWSYSYKLIPWLLNNFHRYDAIILHGLWLFPGYALHRVMRRFSNKRSGFSTLPRLFIMPHGMLDPYFQKAKNRKIKAWRNMIYWQVIEASVVNHASGLLFTCETERLLAHESFSPYTPQQEIVVGLGVVAPPAYTTAMKEAFIKHCSKLKNRSYLLFLGRIHEKKGVDLLIKSYLAVIQDLTSGTTTDTNNLLHEELPALVIAGPGLETTYGQYLQQLTTNLPAAEQVFFVDMLIDDAKWGAFYGCDAFILPSHQENFGIAVVEALACSKPVLISNQVNIWREIISTGGGLVADDTLQGTQHLIQSWFRLSLSIKKEIGIQAQSTYSKYFSVVPASKKIYNALLCECVV